MFELAGRFDLQAANGKLIDILGEENQGSSWSGAERIGLDLIRDEFENIYSIDEFVKDRIILPIGENFPNGVYITENFKLTTKPISASSQPSGCHCFCKTDDLSIWLIMIGPFISLLTLICLIYSVFQKKRQQ